jgi:Trk K+ transport system NAD-binding subunit
VDLIRAYDLALAKRTASRHVLAQVRLGAVSEVEVFEYEIAAGCEVDGKLLKEVQLPEDTLVASIQRGRRLIIPHGVTRLKAGDTIAVVAQSEDQDILEKLLTCP